MFKNCVSHTRRIISGTCPRQQCRNFTPNKQTLEFLGAVKQPEVLNEPNLNYAPGSQERKALMEECSKYFAPDFKPVDIPCVVNGKEIRTGNVCEQTMPSMHSKKLFTFHKADESVLRQAIKGSLEAKEKWEALPLEQKTTIFLKAADLLSNQYRYSVNAAVMLSHSKNAWQAEIDAACETIDFWRFNAHYAQKIYENQPVHHAKSVWNRADYRPLEGFVAAISPFNFACIGVNLAGTPAQVGNVVLWKPSDQAVLSNYHLFNVLREAGLPDGVIQFVPSEGPLFSDVTFSAPELSGLHFTGSTATFKYLWKKLSDNLDHFNSYPRIVGETGGKNFHLMHESANIENFVNQTIRGAFEYQGQKCSATSRVYIPTNKWPEVRELLLSSMKHVKVGQPHDPSTFVAAVIDGKAFKKITGFIDRAKQDKDCEIIHGGTYSDKEGWFVDPTIIVTKNPHSETMREEIFGPVTTIYLYEPSEYEKVLKLVDTTAKYGLTGSIFATDRYVIDQTLSKLRHSCGNVYINDKSTGAVVGQQPFGGGRISGTNDKAGAEFNLMRWISVRSIKENFSNLRTLSYPSNKSD